MSHIRIRNREQRAYKVHPQTADKLIRSARGDDGSRCGDGVGESIEGGVPDGAPEFETLRRESLKRRLVAAFAGGLGLLAVGLLGDATLYGVPDSGASELQEEGSAVSASAKTASQPEPAESGKPKAEEEGEVERGRYSVDEQRKFAELADGKDDTDRTEYAHRGDDADRDDDSDDLEPRDDRRDHDEEKAAATAAEALGERGGVLPEGSGAAAERAFADSREAPSTKSGRFDRGATPSEPEPAVRTRSARTDETTSRTMGSPGADRRSIGSARDADVRGRGARPAADRGLSDDQIRRGMRRISKSVAVCREHQTRRGGPLDVRKIEMTLEVESDGRVASFQTRPSSLQGTVLANCLRSRQSGWEFGEFGGDRVTLENRSFVLQSSG